jgi:hypothetical protein
MRLSFQILPPNAEKIGKKSPFPHLKKIGAVARKSQENLPVRLASLRRSDTP